MDRNPKQLFADLPPVADAVLAKLGLKRCSRENATGDNLCNVRKLDTANQVEILLTKSIVETGLAKSFPSLSVCGQLKRFSQQ